MSDQGTPIATGFRATAEQVQSASLFFGAWPRWDGLYLPIILRPEYLPPAPTGENRT